MNNRLFGIIYLLLNKKAMTARELAEHFSVSQRTIYRDVDALSLSGIPVYTEKGKGGGISLLPEYVLNKSILSEAEQNEILSALQGLSNVKTDETRQVLKKLSSLFKKNLVDWLEVDFSDWSFASDNAFDGFKAAILERRVAEFDYYSSFGEKTRRRVEPIKLWFKHKAWYVKGFCLSRQDIRLFKLVRVKNLTVTEERFSERDLQANRQNATPSEHHKPCVTLRLKIAPEMAYRVYDELDDRQVQRQPDGSFLATGTWPEDGWLYGFVLSFGEYVEVLEPERFRELIREKAQKIADRHK